MKRFHPVWALAVLAVVTAHDGRVAAAPEGGPKSFASPEAAAGALVEGLKAKDRHAVLDILGRSAEEWISSGDREADAAAFARFVEAYDQRHGLAAEGETRAILLIGRDDFPFPFPLVRGKEGWHFDPEEGREEILNRRIGKNELFTIQVLLAIVDAQRDYAAVDRDGNGLLEFAQKFISSPGKKDGLYWPTRRGEPGSPLGPLIGQAAREGYGQAVAEQPSPFHGYYYRMLTAQGKDAPGGDYDYRVGGTVLLRGFAVLAYPAKYGVSGIQSFLVNHQGVVFEKDLGPDTGRRVERIDRYNPDDTWKKN